MLSSPLRLVPTPGICSQSPAIGSNPWKMLSSPPCDWSPRTRGAGRTPPHLVGIGGVQRGARRGARRGPGGAVRCRHGVPPGC
eukprot:6789686-Pyramimonas_sp.AAC.1